MATLTIDLDDEASEGLAQIDAQLEQMAETTDVLTKAQERQIVVVNNNREGWSEFGSTTVATLGSVAQSALECFEAIETAPLRLAEVAIKEGASLAKWGIGATATVLGLNAVFGKHKQVVREAADEEARFFGMSKSSLAGLLGIGAAATDAATGYNLIGAAATRAGKMAFTAMTGLGPQVLGATIALKGYEALLARTGLKTIELADGTTVLESNLDRVNAAAGRLGSDFTRDMGEAAEALSELTKVSIEFPSVWKEIDKIATKSAENLVSNIELVQRGYNEGVMSLRAFAVQMQGGSAEAYREEVKSMLELSDWHAKMDKQREKEAEGFAMLGRANDELRGRQEYRAEQQRLASINTIEGLNREIQATKEAAGASATAGKFDAQAKEEYYQKMDFLELQRAKITENVEKARREQFNKTRKAHEEAINAEQDKLGEYMTRLQEVYDLEYKRGQERARMARELVGTAKSQDFDTAMEAGKDVQESQKQLVEQRLKAQGATEIQIKNQLAEMDKQFAGSVHELKMQAIADESKSKSAALDKERFELERSGITGIEYEKRLSKIKSEEDKIAFDRRKKAIEETSRFDREQNRITIGQQLANQQALFAKEAERISKIKQLNDQALQKAFNPQEVLQSTDPRKVLRQLQEDRARKAGQAQADRDRELWDKGQAGDQVAMNKFARNQRKEMAKARRGAFNDAENGNVGEGELATAQAEVAGESLGVMQQQGRISADMVTGLQEALKAIADQATANEQMQSTVNQLVANAKGMRQVTRRQAENSRNQQGSLE